MSEARVSADYQDICIYSQPEGSKPLQMFFGSFLLFKKELVFGSLRKERTDILRLILLAVRLQDHLTISLI